MIDKNCNVNTEVSCNMLQPNEQSLNYHSFVLPVKRFEHVITD